MNLPDWDNPAWSESLIRKIKQIAPRELHFMEVCGTHTVNMFRYGIRETIQPEVKFISGPGCPVCVTPTSEIDKAIWLSQQKDIIITTYGDMIRVPGSNGISLRKAIAKGATVKIVYAATDSIDIALKNPDKEVVFLAVGFETTSPATAILAKDTIQKGIKNLSILVMHKVIPPAMETLLNDEDIAIDGFLCPGHVSVIIGEKPYQFIPERYYKPAVIGGFKASEILYAIYRMVLQIAKEQPAVENAYKHVVRSEGNKNAQNLLREVFYIGDTEWRGLGRIPNSGMLLKEKFSILDAEKRFQIPKLHSKDPPGCRCGDVLKGIIEPYQCPLFGKVCTPLEPVGPCMVSSEGSCAAYYKYGGKAI